MATGIPCLGIEPTDSTATAAEQLGIPVMREFFGEALGKQLANKGQQADLIVGNNVFAHVPDINDFAKGLKAALKNSGIITLEFHHVMKLINDDQFDTIYHEHFSYLSLNTVIKIFAAAGLRIWHVEELPTHGGSLRVYGCHHEDDRETESSVMKLIQKENNSKLNEIQTYIDFQSRIDKIKDKLLAFLIQQKKNGKKVIAYGAAAKGNTLLNYAGIKPDLLSSIVDGAKSKQGLYMPGSHIPIKNSENIKDLKPDIILVLPWNIHAEIKKKIDTIFNKDILIVSIENYK